MASDLISREAVQEFCRRTQFKVDPSDDPFEVVRKQGSMFKSVIENAPAVDAVEVVRCKDCENWDTDWYPSYSAKEWHWCGMVDLATAPDFFCGHGERKKEDAVD